MGKIVALVLALAGCQPMYHGKSEPLHTPDPGKPPPVLPEAIAYIDDCNFDFHHKQPVAHATANTQLDTQADAQLVKAQIAPTTTERVDIVNGAIDTYSRALRVDPYDPDATLGLARAYDHVQRKGCALALLKRLGELADHSKFRASALPVAQSVPAHTAWFKAYRREAIAALNLP